MGGGIASFLFVFILSHSVSAQTALQGRVMDANDKTPVPYASIIISNSGVGTSNDGEGYFTFAIADEFRNHKLVISCIGYQNSIFSIDSLLAGSARNFIFYLKEQVLVLEEIIVKEVAPNPEGLLREAIAAIPQNYKQEPFNLDFYSNMTVDLDSSVMYRVESVVKTYRKGYIREAMNASRVMHKRETGSNPIKSRDHFKKGDQGYFPYTPCFPIALIDMIGQGDGYSIFNPKKFKQMKFRYVGVNIFDQDTVLVIEYSVKKADVTNGNQELDGKYNGLIHISANSLAIIKHELIIGDWRNEIVYRKFGNHYFPYLIKSVRSAWREDKYLVRFNIYLQQVIEKNVEAFELNPENCAYEKVAYKNEFWEKYYPLRNTAN